MFNASYRRVGGLRFLRIGRLSLSWCIARPVIEVPVIEVPLRHYAASDMHGLVFPASRKDRVRLAKRDTRHLDRYIPVAYR